MVVVVVVIGTWVEGERKEWSMWNAHFLFLVGEEGCVKNLSLTTLEKHPEKHFYKFKIIFFLSVPAFKWHSSSRNRCGWLTINTINQCLVNADLNASLFVLSTGD